MFWLVKPQQENFEKPCRRFSTCSFLFDPRDGPAPWCSFPVSCMSSLAGFLPVLVLVDFGVIWFYFWLLVQLMAGWLHFSTLIVVHHAIYDPYFGSDFYYTLDTASGMDPMIPARSQVFACSSTLVKLRALWDSVLWGRNPAVCHPSGLL